MSIKLKSFLTFLKGDITEMLRYCHRLTRSKNNSSLILDYILSHNLLKVCPLAASIHVFSLLMKISIALLITECCRNLSQDILQLICAFQLHMKLALAFQRSFTDIIHRVPKKGRHHSHGRNSVIS